MESESTKSPTTSDAAEGRTRLATQTELDASADLTVTSADGESTKFGSLWRKEDNPRRNIIVFIRHFYCDSCEDYVRALSTRFSPEDLMSRPLPTNLTIIGCGDPTLIQEYKKRTGCKFEVLADPSRALYDNFGMTCSLALGEKPEYITKSFLASAITGARNNLSHPFSNPGKRSQNGGELIFVDGELVWMSRMQSTRDHTEVSELSRLLEGQE